MKRRWRLPRRQWTSAANWLGLYGRLTNRPYRQLFLPELAANLNNLGSDLSALGQREEALAAYEEAVRTLVPSFRALPAAFADWMQTMLENYLQACQEGKQQPDRELVEEVRRGTGLILCYTCALLPPGHRPGAPWRGGTDPRRAGI